METIRIDSHQHFWKLTENEYKWLTKDLGEIYRDFMPDDLYPFIKKYKIDKTIVVQAAPTIQETVFLLSLKEQYDWIAGVIGWLDLSKPTFKRDLKNTLKYSGFIGLRPMIQDLEDDDWILREKVLTNIQVLIEYDVPLDLLIRPRHIPYILRLLEIYPKLRAVVNHIAKPNIAEGQFDGWKEGLENIAAFPNVMCKLSGFITEAGYKNWTIEQFKPYITQTLKIFEPHRVMFGSDWPVCNLSGSYDDVMNCILKNLSDYTNEKELSLIFGENAKRFYKL